MIMLFVLTNAFKTLDHSVLILCLKHGVGNKGVWSGSGFTHVAVCEVFVSVSSFFLFFLSQIYLKSGFSSSPA